MLLPVFRIILGATVRPLHSPVASWTVANATSDPVPAPVPGVVHQALLSAGILSGDPLYRYNELSFAWVAETAWTYRGVFTLNDTELRTFDAGTVQFEGLVRRRSRHPPSLGHQPTLVARPCRRTRWRR